MAGQFSIEGLVDDFDGQTIRSTLGFDGVSFGVVDSESKRFAFVNVPRKMLVEVPPLSPGDRLRITVEVL